MCTKPTPNHNQKKEDHARRTKEVVSASSSAAAGALSTPSGQTNASTATAAVAAAAAAAAAKTLTLQPPVVAGISTGTTPTSTARSSNAMTNAQRRGGEAGSPGLAGGSLVGSAGGSGAGGAGSAKTAVVEGTGARGTGWAGLFDGPPRTAVRGGGIVGAGGAKAPGGYKRETPRLRWLARALRDSVAERVWAPAVATAGGSDGSGGGGSSGGAGSSGGGGSGGGIGGSSGSSGAVEAMKLLLEDLAHSYQGRRVSARRALQSVLACSPAGRRGGSSVRSPSSVGGGTATAAMKGERRVAWTPAAKEGRRPGRDGGNAERGGGEGRVEGGSAEEEGKKGEDRVVVLQEEADEEQCGWLFWCRDLPAWVDVSTPYMSYHRPMWRIRVSYRTASAAVLRHVRGKGGVSGGQTVFSLSVRTVRIRLKHSQRWLG